MLLLKNTHLCTSWLASTLDKKLQTLRPNGQFRIFLTLETNPKVCNPPCLHTEMSVYPSC